MSNKKKSRGKFGNFSVIDTRCAALLIYPFGNPSTFAFGPIVILRTTVLMLVPVLRARLSQSYEEYCDVTHFGRSGASHLSDSLATWVS